MFFTCIEFKVYRVFILCSEIIHVLVTCCNVFFPCCNVFFPCCNVFFQLIRDIKLTCGLNRLKCCYPVTHYGAYHWICCAVVISFQLLGPSKKAMISFASRRGVVIVKRGNGQVSHQELWGL